MASATSNGYKYLEFKEHPVYKSPWIIGTRINVGTLMVQYNAWGYKMPEDLARDRDLPLDAVLEAIDWYSHNKKVVTKECRLERRLLSVKD